MATLVAFYFMKIKITENNRSIRIPVIPVGEFVKESLQTIDIAQNRGIQAVMGKLQSEPQGTTVVQEYIFLKEKGWTIETASEWVKQNTGEQIIRSSQNMDKKHLQGYVEKIDDMENGVISVAVATSGAEDRDGEILDPNGWDLEHFTKNPVLLWAHDHREEPIGKVLDLQRDGDRILFKPQFAIDVSEKARRIFEFFKRGVLSTFSVGFIAKERQGNKITKMELLEISAVNVPSNPEAMVLVRSVKGEDLDLSLLDNKALAHELRQSLKEKNVLKTKLSGVEQQLQIAQNANNDLMKNGSKGRGKRGTLTLLLGKDNKRALQKLDKAINEVLRQSK